MNVLLNIDTSFLDRVFFHERVRDYIMFAVIVLATLLIKKRLAVLLTRISSRIAARFSYVKHRETMGSMLFKPVERLLQVIFYFFAAEQLSGILDSIRFRRSVQSHQAIEISLGDVTDHIFLFLFILFLTQVVTRSIDFIYYMRLNSAREEKNLSKQQMLPLIKEMSKMLAWVMCGFWVMGSVFHVNVPALITGLGIGGVAIALAGKETVENFFAAFTILSDKVFQIGDTIKLGDTEGTVERIGFRSTRLRGADGAALIIPNQNFVSQNLVNLSMRDDRVVKVTVNIKYGMSHGQLTKLIDQVRDTLMNTHPVKGPVDITIDSFDKETFQVNIAYHVPHPLPDGLQLNAVKRDINLKVFELIATFGQMGTAVGTS